MQLKKQLPQMVSLLSLLLAAGYVILLDRATVTAVEQVFLGIFLEALPFILIGSFASALIRLYLREDQLVKLIPKQPILGVIIAASIGFIIPLCECAIVPVMRRLIEKKLPLRMALAFMLATPIVNPVVLLSTYYAFNNWKMVAWRAGLGFVGAVIIGLLVEVWQAGRPALLTSQTVGFQLPIKQAKQTAGRRVEEILHHTSSELFDVGRYLIFGSLLAAGLNVLVSKASLLQLGGQGVVGIIVLLGLAFLISLCSESDAFVARTFLGNFSQSAILGFLILGPMIDIKNSLLLTAYFKTSFVSRLIITIFTVCFSLAVILLWGGLV